MLRTYSSLIRNAKLLFGLLILVLASCSQEPAFVEQYDRNQKSNDAVAVDPNGIDDEGIHPDDKDKDKKPTTEEPVNPDDGGDGETPDGGDDTDGNGDDGSDGIGNDDGGGEAEIPTITRDMTFDSDNQGGGESRMLLDDPYIEQDITLKRNNANKEKFFEQRSRPMVRDRFQQGHGPEPLEESFRQVADRPLDILVVVDNSGSMEEEQANLASKLAPLLSKVQDANWRIGVTSTDPNRKCLEQVIYKGDANASTKFRNAVTLGASGSGNERGVLMAVRGLQGSCLNTPWVRSNSTLAVLIVSDEDNCSDGTDCGTESYAYGSYLYNYLSGIRTPGQNARVYGIFWHPSQTSDQCSTGYSKANIYSQLVADTQGTWGSICDASYEDTLETVSENIQTVLASRFTLQYTPVAETVEVYINDQLQTAGYALNGNVVEFATPPLDSDLIKIKYGHSPQPIVNTFTASKKVYGDPLSVKVNGVEALPGEYSYNPANRKITFGSPPGDRAQIEVEYLEDIDLIKDFLLFDDAIASTIKVEIDGVETTDFSYVSFLRSVSFAVPPPAGSEVVFRYTVEGPAILNYPFAIENGPPMDLMAYDAYSQAAVGVSWSNNTLTVSGNDFAEGRLVTVRYDNVQRQELSVELPMDPVPGSITVTADGQACADPSSLQVNGRVVDIMGCDFPDQADEVTVAFRYVIESYTTFTFEADELPEETEYQEWKVFVNGTQTNKFTREGNVITVTEELPPGAKVKVSLTQYQ